MEYLALAIGLIGILAAWRASRQVKALDARLDATNDRYFALLNHTREIEETMQHEVVELRVELKRQAGLLKFEPQMSIQEIYDMHPRAAEVLAGFHLGGCASCAVNPDQTLASAALQHNLDLDQLLGALQQLADGRSGGSSAPVPQFRSDPDLKIIA